MNFGNITSQVILFFTKLFPLIASFSAFSVSDNKGGTTSTVKTIDTLVKVTGLNTGYSVDLPVRFAKL